MKYFSLILSLLLVVGCTQKVSNVRKQMVLDEGGSGPYKAVGVADSTLQGLTIYRPQDLNAAVDGEGRALPLMVFANGACTDCNAQHWRMLSDIASYGYIVIAVGELQDSINDRKHEHVEPDLMIKGLNWAEQENNRAESEYESLIDMDNVCLAGMSCGGAMTMSNSADSRIKTYIMFNSGMGDIQMAGASTENLKDVHGPVLYMLGGESDIAYNNALTDYDRLNHVPVAFSSQLRVGHGGTYHELYGGDYSVMARYWLDWQLKNNEAHKDVFLNNNLEGFSDWRMKSKGFKELNGTENDPYRVEELCVKTRNGQNIWGQLYIPNIDKKPIPMIVMAHGFNSSHGEPKEFAISMAMNGVASYIFDFIGGGNNCKSDGKTTDMTIFTEKENVEDIVEAIKNLDFVDPNDVSLLGCSQGGLVAAITSSANPDMFRNVILIYPALMIPDTAPRMLESFKKNGNKPMDVMGMKLSRKYYEVQNGLDVLGMLPSYKGHVLMVYGDADPVCKGGTLEKAQQTYENCQSVIIPGANHGFPEYKNHAIATKAIAEFMR
ncbi:MAG: alpha/beta hydrolase [Bacteroidales bacterium]|nr:alpha/beta hydrolase [Bacteroidales bacterium]